MNLRWALGIGRWALIATLMIAGVAGAQDMPDPSLIHGRAIPASELGDGVVTVRVVREAIGNNIGSQQVQLTVSGRTRTATTDEQGRAEFTNLPKGEEARAEATVDGEALTSQPFRVPTAGGLRVILVAGIAKAAERKKQEEAAAAAGPAVKGVVVFGGNTRVLMQFREDTLEIYYVLEILNTARSRVDIGEPLVINFHAVRRARRRSRDHHRPPRSHPTGPSSRDLLPRARRWSRLRSGCRTIPRL
jgi:hypothetical protein